MYSSSSSSPSARLLSGATHDDLTRVSASLTANERILAVWKVDEDSKRAMANSFFAPFVCPCFWPHLLMCSPLFCAMYYGQRASLDGLTFFVTNENLYVESHVESKCCSTGRDSGFVKLIDITGIHVNNKGEGCAGACGASSVNVGVPLGSPLISGGSKKNRLNLTCNMPCDDPQTVSDIIRKAKDAADSRLRGAGPMQPPPTVETSGPIDLLKQLKSLLDSGVLTQREFDEKKAVLLSRI